MKLPSNRRRRKSIIIPTVICNVLAVGFLTWLVITLASQTTELELTTTYELPEFTSLESLAANGEWAIAVDGAVAASSVNRTNETDSNLAIRPTASTAKMITALAVIQKKPFELGTTGETLTISQEFYDRYLWYVRNNGSNIPVRVGEEISEYDALAAMLMASANNFADNLAEWAFGSLDDYRKYASEMLHEWGLNDTTIGVDASGFDASTTSTAADLARIGQKVLENPVLAEIVGTKSAIIPVAGTITNTNTLLGTSGIIGVKTGFIGDISGYCLVTGYHEGEHTITTALLGADTRTDSFNGSLRLVEEMQSLVKEQKLISAGDLVGYYDSWWTGPVKIMADTGVSGLGWQGATTGSSLEMTGDTGILKIKIGNSEYTTNVHTEAYNTEPSLGDRLGHAFGWTKEGEAPTAENSTEPTEKASESLEEKSATEQSNTDAATNIFTNAPSDNCTIKYGALMLINPNFTVDNNFISARRGELISISDKYGIIEGNAYNGDNLLDAEAAEHINEMVNAYKAEYPGHTLETRSCFRAVGTNCGRLCAATGASDHHTGLTCDLLDPAYGTSLDTDTYSQHPDWQWLKANSYKYGFIDRFPEAWAGGSMSEPLNVDANGTTGLYETWHYRYVGVGPATEIATGKYNNGQYDSLEHYLKARGLVADLKNGICK